MEYITEITEQGDLIMFLRREREPNVGDESFVYVYEFEGDYYLFGAHPREGHGPAKINLYKLDDLEEVMDDWKFGEIVEIYDDDIQSEIMAERI
ncbi:hypothetical protein [Halorubrum ezzemoulense]|uniref:hypothetical protein n=1 Tax=Halorubrum ezzemoulense TaxID=337243 RepID=UPI00113FF0D5|nr:hypothetical protein [Halorubrum ezzemoulense]